MPALFSPCLPTALLLCSKCHLSHLRICAVQQAPPFHHASDDGKRRSKRPFEGPHIKPKCIESTGNSSTGKIFLIGSFMNEKTISTVQSSVLCGQSPDGWDKCWEQGATPWDLGAPVPVILDLLRTGALPKGRVLVPGCGSGYDVVAMAGPERYVVGLDTSENAVKKAMEADFFTWHPSEMFDLIFDYTFFCAIEPSMRSAWASRVQDLLKPDGELITLMFPISDHVGGPPYKVSVADYEEVLCPMGFEAISVIDNELAIKPRKGREKLGRWKKRSLKQSLL